MSYLENLGDNERPLSKEEFQQLVNPKTREDFGLTDKEVAGLNVFPPATQEELEIIRNATPEQRETAAKRIFEQVLDEMFTFIRLKRRIKWRSPN